MSRSPIPAREGHPRDDGERAASGRGSTWARLAALAATVALTACGQATEGDAGGGAHEHVGEAESAVFTNGGFESGTAGQAPPGWTVVTNLNPGITIQSPQTKAGLNLAGGGTPLTVTLNAPGGPETQTDPALGAAASFRWPKFGNKVAIVNGQASGNNRNVNTLTQTMTVDAGDIDPIDGQIHVRATLAPVLENPGHANAQQPYFFVQLTNVTTNKILYQDFNFSAQPGVAWKTANNGALYYTDWTLIDIPGGAGIKAGDSIKLEIIGAGCSLGGHYGQVYVDSVGTTVPGLFVAATAPKAANAGTDITYTLTYKDGSPVDAAGVKVDFTTPPNTTFVSYNAPGLTCTAPNAGQTGLVSCTIGALKAGASGTYTITVNINPGASGVVTQGNYVIYATGVSPLYGSKVTTIIGCQQDSDCNAGNWCHVSSVAACLPTLANGTAMPTDPGHSNPTLNGTCSQAAGALVCTSGVCDSDNKCGYLNGSGSCTQQNAATVCRSGVCGADGKCGYPNTEGPCTGGNAATVCRSAVCDPDLKCGYADGDGPCTKQNQLTVCRSGSCSANGLCQPAGGCNVDGDCTNGDWCNMAQHVCAAKLANGTSMPSDPPHQNPTLDAKCAVQAAQLVCQSLVCDTKDDKCGYANGDGPCTAQNGGTVCRSAVCDPDLKCGYDVNHGPCTKQNAAVVCRSGQCSANGLCQPVGGCNVDADCSNGNWCAAATHTCTPKLANGTSMPNDPPHQNPTLNAKCTQAAATLVCESGVCDVKDDKCGYADLDGPCTLQNGGTVCRSKVCSFDGTCVAAGGCNVDQDCAEGNFCMIQTHTCTPRLPNGAPIPTDPPHQSPALNGTCTQAAGALVCQALVCDTKDNKCGYANDDGPCTKQNQGTVCRSGACSVAGTCMPVGGCNVDGDCQATEWCNIGAHTCTPKLANGVSMPTDAPHKNPTLDGKCTQAAGALVCQALVCDLADDKCGYANGDGPCTKQNQGTVCRSGACSADGTCMPVGGCNIDADCGAFTWCNMANHACSPTLENGQPMPSDPPHKTPTLDATCTPEAAKLVCISLVCDTKDSLCGYGNGTGPCDAQNAAVVCRSKACSQDGLCMPEGGCNVDADCKQGQWCSIATNTCKPTLDNGQPMPSDPPHQQPTLDGTCTPEASTLVCTSGVCDKDALCGYADGSGPCTPQNGSIVCRSGACSANGTCAPAGGCNVDADCAAEKWCEVGTHTCKDKLPNGQHVPTDPGHGSPTLDGTCTAESGALTCTSGVCDQADDLCGYADGTGPCTQQNAGDVCRSGVCSADGTCAPKAGCNVDADCANDTWCEESSHTCKAKLANGKPMPNDPPHDAPKLDGTCTAEAATLVCASGVCDPKDDKCGLADGDGPCTDQNGDVVCRSGVCTNGICGAPTGCKQDADCPKGTPVCEVDSGKCVECTAQKADKCAGDTPICDDASKTCVPCDGDKDSGAKHACTQDGAPLCMDGACGKCQKDADCKGHLGGSICDVASGACLTGCKSDADCDKTEWCDAVGGAAGVCHAKLDNGAHLPQKPTTVSTCDETVGARVCKSGVCDTKDDTCGLLPGDGPCDTDAVCRSTKCDLATHLCAPPETGCTKDAECGDANYCKAGQCLPKQPVGTLCDAPNQCQSATCDESKCSDVIASGNGLVCSVQNAGSTRDDGALAALGLALAAVGLARRRRR